MLGLLIIIIILIVQAGMGYDPKIVTSVSLQSTVHVYMYMCACVRACVHACVPVSTVYTRGCVSVSPDGVSCHEYRAAGDVTQSEDISLSLNSIALIIVLGLVHTLETRPGVQRTL